MNKFQYKWIQIREKILHGIFFLIACVSILVVGLICIFLFSGGIPAMNELGIVNFLTGVKWKPGNDLYGIFPMILGSVYTTVGAIILGVPIGILTAIFLARFCPNALYRILKPAIALLAGIPSIVYGFFGLIVLVPFVRIVFGGDGQSIWTASILLAIMILPSIISVGESSLHAVPEQYYEGGLALGASHERSVFFIVLPAAKSGILAGIVLGIGRAIGETMAVMMVVGNQTRVPNSMLDGVRTLTTNIVLDMGYATDLHREALIATAVVLFAFVLLLNLLFSILKRREL